MNLSGNRDEEEPPAATKETVAEATQSSTQDQNHPTVKGLSGSLPSVPFAPPPPTPRAAAPAPAAAPTSTPQQPPQSQPSRGVFSWFTRSSSASKEVKPPPGTASRPRGDTTASASTLSSNVEHAHNDGTEYVNGVAKKPRRGSIRDQFKIVRLREEGAISENDGASIASGNASVKDQPTEKTEGEGGDHTTGSKASTSSATVNPSLPPGTVSGIHTSATDAAAPVDWELWQQLVNQGPVALTGANSEQLLMAIKRGIPQTIRGLIWQVLADSRSPELEDVYRGLVARGTEKEQVNGASSGTASENDKDEPADSSRSSVRSDKSGTAGVHLSNGVLRGHELDPEKHAREQAAAEAAHQRKAKDDAVMLQKLEKAIRRDLGGRTSYSKFFVSQCSQDALFGLCKAYALYDESVGYAQGMNFIAMPLLFNVSLLLLMGEAMLIAICRWMRPKHLRYLSS